MYKEGFGEPRFPDKGRLRESNPRPLVPKTRIIPLDQSDNPPLIHFLQLRKKSGAKNTFGKSVTKSLTNHPKVFFAQLFLKVERSNRDSNSGYRSQNPM